MDIRFDFVFPTIKERRITMKNIETRTAMIGTMISVIKEIFIIQQFMIL